MIEFMTPIKEMIKNNDIETLHLELKKYSADDISNSHLFSDQTLFMYACEKGTPEVVKIFIDCGTYCYELKYGDDTEFKCAAANKKHSYEIMSLLLDMFKNGREVALELLNSNGDE